MTDTSTPATTTAAPTKTTRSPKAGAAPTQPLAEVVTPALKASALQENLKRALAMVMHAVAGKSMLPVLSNILLSTEGTDRLKISATNLEIGIVVVIAAKVERAGAITLPARLLADVVSGLPNQTITLEMDARTQSAFLSCGRFECNIKGIEADEFPIIPTIDERAPSASFAPEALCCAISQVAFAAASDETRPILTGVRIALNDKLASFAAADSLRLTFRDIVLDKAVTQAQEVVVPARAMETLGKVMGDVEGQVEMLIDAGDRVLFRAEGVELVSRAIQGRYPNIGKYLGLTFDSVLTIETKALAKAVKLASFFAVTSSNIIRLELTPAADGKGSLTLSANAAEVGDNKSVHEVGLCGTGGKVALNVRFLAEGLAAVSTPSVAIHLNSAQQPVVLRGVGDESYCYVAMPMSVR